MSSKHRLDDRGSIVLREREIGTCRLTAILAIRAVCLVEVVQNAIMNQQTCKT